MFKQQGLMSQKELTDNVNSLLSVVEQLTKIIGNNQETLTQVIKALNLMNSNKGGNNENTNC